ncbi:hypothetical protein BN1012_Phect2104 [Candidatus Phaeomarinobacter ectocarpi]|uniref:Uncharacterized protein n=1 Tax=Candidatus Phaeomarinibacter ectocarpi TaxID=1458461 RepID=X5MDN1_9HYPH|nr:hypothetical protein BN1012_Phect2104 [Candidatus Phaeomarinobacter ectocarpi]
MNDGSAFGLMDMRKPETKKAEAHLQHFRPFFCQKANGVSLA